LTVIITTLYYIVRRK